MQHTAPSTLSVSSFFKQNPSSKWSLDAYIEQERKTNPFADYKTFAYEFKKDLNIIQNSADTPNDLKSVIGSPIKAKQKDKKKAETSSTIYNTNVTATSVGAIYTGSTKCINTLPSVAESSTSQPPARSHASGANASNASDTSPSIAGTKRKEEYNVSPGESSLKSLYPLVYSLYKKEAAVSIDLPIKDNSCLSHCLYNLSVDLINNFATLSPTQKSLLHVALSGCVNTVSMHYRPAITAAIGEEKLEAILNSHALNSFAHYNNNEWKSLLEELKMAYDAGGASGLRLFVLSSRLAIYTNKEEESKSLSLKVLDMYEVVLNSIQYRKWTSERLEQEFGEYWVPIFRILFRGSGLDFKIGESTCNASKFDRQINEGEYGETAQSVMGRRIDMIVKAPLTNENNNADIIEMSAMEVKPLGVSTDVELRQMNKNIRVNKSILNSLLVHMCGDSIGISTIGIDIIGLSGYLYSVKQYEDVIAAVKVVDDNIFLPCDEDDLQDFMDGNTIDQLLSYVDHLQKLHSTVVVSSRRHKRLRASSKTSCQMRRSSPSPTLNFPTSTFYTPKRQTTKKQQ